MSDMTEQSDRPDSPELLQTTRKRGRKPFQRTTYSDFQLTSLQNRFEEKRYLTMQERAGTLHLHCNHIMFDMLSSLQN